MENSVAKLMRTMSRVVFVAGTVGSIVLGKVMPLVDYSYSLYGGINAHDSYNWGLAIAGEGATVISGIFFVWGAEVIDLLQSISEGQQKGRQEDDFRELSPNDVVNDIESDLPNL